MASGSTAKPWIESTVLSTMFLALLIAAAVAGGFTAPQVWGLVTALASLYVLSRGIARSSWSPARRDASPPPTAPPPSSPTAAPPAAEPQPDTADDAAVEVVLSEERLKVESRPVPRERVQIRKEIVTEEVTITVALRREELRVERVPLDAPERTDSELDLVLVDHEPIVAKEIVARERVRIDKDVVTTDEQITEPVRKEQVEVERLAPRAPTEGAR